MADEPGKLQGNTVANENIIGGVYGRKLWLI